MNREFAGETASRTTGIGLFYALWCRFRLSMSAPIMYPTNPAIIIMWGSTIRHELMEPWPLNPSIAHEIERTVPLRSRKRLQFPKSQP